MIEYDHGGKKIIENSWRSLCVETPLTKRDYTTRSDTTASHQQTRTCTDLCFGIPDHGIVGAPTI